MATQETVVDQKPLDLAPLDPNVIVPKHVREAAERAAAIYQEAYAQPEAPPAEAPPAEAAPEAPPPTEVANSPAPVNPPVNKPAAEPDWEQRFNSMKGRWQSNERMMGEMRAQMDQMAVELRRSQELLNQPQQKQPVHESLITQDERETYGDDMLNVTRKVAIEAIAPELQAIQAQNEELKNQLLQQKRNDTLQQLSQAVPNWRSIVATEEWKNWLRLPNVYTGEVRGKVLNAAREAANAPRVIAIFNEYVRDIQATGGQLPGQRVEEQPMAPRTPAIPLANLASPGRARPSSGELPNSVADKPTYTRQQIAAFYSDVRRARTGQGPYVGRETEIVRIEQDISLAQREGRVR